MSDFVKLMEGPEYEPHLQLRQVGWLGHTGDMYPWWDAPYDDREPAGFMPVYIEIGD